MNLLKKGRGRPKKNPDSSDVKEAPKKEVEEDQKKKKLNN